MQTKIRHKIAQYAAPLITAVVTIYAIKVIPLRKNGGRSLPIMPTGRQAADSLTLDILVRRKSGMSPFYLDFEVKGVGQSIV